MKNSIILFSMLLGIGLSACKPDYQQGTAEEAVSEATPVRTEMVELSNEVLPVTGVGLLSSSQQVKHAFKIGGIIQDIFVEEGDFIRSGQVLAILEMKEINAQVSKAQENVDKWIRDEARVARLYDDSAATLEQLQDVNTGLEVAKADLEIASYNQNYAKIIARQPGRVLTRFAEEGELISPGLPVLLSSNQGNGTFVLKVGLADKDLVRIRVGDSARVSFDALPETSFPALVSDIAPQASLGTGTFEVELQLTAPGSPLRNGFVGVAEIFPSEDRAYYKIPLDAVVEAEGKEAKVYFADTTAKEARLQSLILAAIGDDFILVDTTGLDLNAPIITAGSGFLTPSSKISFP